MLATETIVRISPLVPLTMVVILAASVWVFATLVRRQTQHRKLLAMSQWAKSQQLRLTDPTTIDAATILPALVGYAPKISMLLHGPAMTIVQVRTENTSPSATQAASGIAHWHLLQLPLEDQWPTTGLRPAAHARSLIDLFGLTSFPSLVADRRFMMFGQEARAATALARSAVSKILAADVGLLLHEHGLILDFSSRPFDEIEFARLVEIARQLRARLLSPVAPAPAT